MSPVNALSRQIFQELEQALQSIRKEDSLRSLVFRSAKKSTFIAGADIHELAKLHSANQAMEMSKYGQDFFNVLAEFPIPTIAVISGACLGGGLELALACDYRIVVNDVRTQLGFPEVELGLLPAWGGTQRLPRTVGLERALQMILTGRRLRAAEAVRWGLADEMVENGTEALPDFLNSPVKNRHTSLPKNTFKQRWIDGTRLGRMLIYRGTERILKNRLPEDMPAPWEALHAIRTGISQGMEAGLQAERSGVAKLASSVAARNLIQIFLRREKAKAIPGPGGEGEPPIRTVGVVGAGTMGAGIAQLASLRDCEVVVQEVSDTALGIGMLRIVGLFEHAVKRGAVSKEDYPKKLQAIRGSTSWKGYADLDLVIEAALEDLDVKKKLFEEMEERVSPSTILTTNTSALLVGDLQKGRNYPERVAGLHFFNPVHRIPLVEVIRAPQTSEEVVNQLRRFVIQLGKIPVVVRDSPGFLVNRILMPYLNEAVYLVSQGMRIEVVDKAMVRFGMPLGPLELLDRVGLDVGYHVVQAIKKVFSGRFSPHPAFEIFSTKGWLGQKSGSGFYLWKGKTKKVHLAVQTILQTLAQKQGIQPLESASSADLMEQARERMVALMVNESASCLAEQLVADADSLDLAMVLGTGWAPHRGGPLQYGKDRGYANILASLERFAKQEGKRFQPSEELRKLAAI